MKVSFYNKKGQKLAGILDTPKNKTKKIIIIMHGLKGGKSTSCLVVLAAEYFIKQGYSVFRFDFNSHGNSYNNWKNFTRFSCGKDFEAAIKYVKKIGFKKIGVFTTSMGADAFLMYPKVDCAVLHDPWFLTSLMRDWIKDYEDEHRARGYVRLFNKESGQYFRYGIKFLNETLNTDKSYLATRVNCPTRIIYGDEKSLTPKAQNKQYNLFHCIKDKVYIKELHHWKISKQNKKLYSSAIQWFDKYL